VEKSVLQHDDKKRIRITQEKKSQEEFYKNQYKKIIDFLKNYFVIGTEIAVCNTIKQF
jgi:hypothetical protein